MFIQENPINYEEFFPRSWFEDASSRIVIREKIRWAKHTLKRSDRIMWYLRFVRLAIANEYNLRDDYNAFIEKYNKKTKGLLLTESTSIDRGYQGGIFVRYTFPSGEELSHKLERDLEHYLALDLPKINDYEFSWQLPYELFADLKEIEDNYLETIGSYIPFDQAIDYPVLIDFKDGYVWFNTEERSAEDRTYATTGHCSTCYNYDEIALVLREHVVVDDKDFWRPVLQFCVDPNGMLGEMKGKANNKPSSKYFKYVIPLLQHKIVKGIKSGGHKPHTNFALTDLPNKDKKKLEKLKPALLTLKEYVNIYGFDKKVIKRLRDTIGLPLVYDKKSRNWLVELESDTTLHELLKDIGNPITKWLADVVYGEEFLDFYDYSFDYSQWFYLIKDTTQMRLDKLKEKDFNEYEDVLRLAGIHALEAGAYDEAYEILFKAIKNDVICDLEVYLEGQDYTTDIEDIPVIIKAECMDSPATAYVYLTDLIKEGFTFTTSIEGWGVNLAIGEHIDIDGFNKDVFNERLDEELDERGF